MRTEFEVADRERSEHVYASFESKWATCRPRSPIFVANYVEPIEYAQSIRLERGIESERTGRNEAGAVIGSSPRPFPKSGTEWRAAIGQDDCL